MKTEGAVALIRPALEGAGGRWADLGAGTGTFTEALVASLDGDLRVIAVDRDARAVAALRRLAVADPRITVARGDFTRLERIDAIARHSLDGVLLANALHFVRDPAGVLRTAASYVRSGGRIVLVEYDRDRGNPWVPYPIPRSRLPDIARDSGLTEPDVVATRPSVYHGEMYCAVVSKP